MRNTRLHHGTRSLRDRNEGRQIYYINPKKHICWSRAYVVLSVIVCASMHLALTLTKGSTRLWSHLHSNLFVLRHITHGLIQKVGHYLESTSVSLSHSHYDSLPVMNLLILNLYFLSHKQRTPSLHWQQLYFWRSSGCYIVIISINQTDASQDG